MVRAPSDFAWVDAMALVAQKGCGTLHVFRLDEVWGNVDDVREVERRLTSRLHDAAREQRRAAWRQYGEQHRWALAERQLLRRMQRVLAARAEAYDPRLDELERIAGSIEALWRSRLGDEDFVAWRAGSDADDEPFRPRPARFWTQAPKDGELVSATSWQRCYTASALAWIRAGEIAREVQQHAEGLAKRGGRDGEAMARLARRMRCLSQAGLAFIGVGL